MHDNSPPENRPFTDFNIVLDGTKNKIRTESVIYTAFIKLFFNKI